METPLIPRKAIFGNPDKASVQLSPDGAQIAYLAPLDGVLNVWVAPRDNVEDARPVTRDTGRGIRFFLWAYTSAHLLFIQDKNGDENWRVYCAGIASGEVKDLTPFDGAQAQMYQVTHRHPQEIVVGLNNRDPQWHDVYRINIASGERSLLLENNNFMEFLVSDENELAAAAQMTAEGAVELFRRSQEGWVYWETIPQEDALTSGFAGLDKSGTQVYFRDSRGRDTSALVLKDLATGEARLLAEDSRCDVEGLIVHPTEKAVQAVSFIYERKYWQVLDPAIQPDLDFLRGVADGDVEINSRSLDDRYWIVVYGLDTSPARYYLYDRAQRKVQFLFTNHKALEGYPLVKMYPAVIPASDGQPLVGYYSLPLGTDSDGDGIPDHPLPMVFTPHGGPWGRDNWGFDPWHQWLANRGYAVMNVNFRASTGFGKAFVNAGDREWGSRVREDQVDAVQWAISQGIAAADKVAVMGGSFGGYSTLAGLTFTPELFACGVDLVGPANLVTLLESVPPYWKPMLQLFTTRVGDFRTEEGRALLKKHSPLTYAEQICRPLLIGQGANDPRVKQAESDQIVQAMQAKNIPVTYLIYPDEGHGFARPENRLSFNATAEAFLAKHLGGRFEPVGTDFENSSIQVAAGKEEVPGL